jgi:nitroreductase
LEKNPISKPLVLQTTNKLNEHNKLDKQFCEPQQNISPKNNLEREKNTLELRKAILGRRSIRKFLKKEIPEELVKEILSDAQWAPSWGNTQAWEIMVVTGSPLEEFKQKNKAALFSGVKPNPEIKMPEVFPAQLKKRYVHVGKSVLQSLSIDRKDLDGRLNYYGDMFYLFDAPTMVLFLLRKDVLLEYAMLDVGLCLQTLLLSAHDKGLGGIALAASVNYPDILRALFPIGADKTIVMGAVLGWPDHEAPVNRFERQRAGLNDTVTWIET